MRRRSAAADFALVGAVAAVLVGVHLLAPPEVQARLAFDHRSPDVFSLFTAAYVHVNDAHLGGNLVGFVATALLVSLVCRQVGRSAWFHRTSAVYLVALPALVNLANYLVLATWFPRMLPTNRGFSGVVAGYGGFLAVALFVFVRRRYNRTIAVYVGFAVALAVFAEVPVAAGRGPSVLSGGLLALGVLFAGFGIRLECRRGTVSVERRRAALDAVYVGLVVAFLLALVSGLVQTAFVVDGRLTNVFAHAAGFVFGIALSTATALVDRPSRQTDAVAGD